MKKQQTPEAKLRARRANVRKQMADLEAQVQAVNKRMGHAIYATRESTLQKQADRVERVIKRVDFLESYATVQDMRSLTIRMGQMEAGLQELKDHINLSLNKIFKIVG